MKSWENIHVIERDYTPKFDSFSIYSAKKKEKFFYEISKLLAYPSNHERVIATDLYIQPSWNSISLCSRLLHTVKHHYCTVNVFRFFRCGKKIKMTLTIVSFSLLMSHYRSTILFSVPFCTQHNCRTIKNLPLHWREKSNHMQNDIICLTLHSHFTFKYYYS